MIGRCVKDELSTGIVLEFFPLIPEKPGAAQAPLSADDSIAY